MTAPQPDFDRIARAYRWMEYATLGRTLERVRERFLPLLAACRQAIVAGDGDGRFTAKLMAANPSVQVQAIDISAAMLGLLRARAPRDGRLDTWQGSALDYRAPVRPDLIVTHFFLDCLAQHEVDELVARLAAELLPGGLWVVSEFQVPRGAMRAPAWIVVRSLYLAFRVLTGLRVTRLPDYTSALTRAGLARRQRVQTAGGLLVSELWVRPDAPRQKGLYTATDAT